MALKPLSDTVPKVTAKTFQRKFVQLGRIVEHWEDIVGPDMAAKAQPLKIHYRKKKGQKKKVEATLEIAASSADASIFIYQKDIIKMKINQIFGDEWITDIKFKHITPDVKKAPSPKKRKTKLSANEEKNLSEMLENIDDPDIKSRLQSLGEALLKDKE